MTLLRPQQKKRFAGSNGFIIILVATALSALANFAIQYFLARTLGPSQFGALYTALATVSLLAPLAAFGVGNWWLKVFGEEGVAAKRWIKPSLKFSSLSTLAVVTILIAWGNFGPHDSLVSSLLVTLSALVFAQVIIDLVNVKFQIESNNLALALWQLISHPLRLLSLLLLLLFFPLTTLSHIANLYLVTAILVTSIGAFILFRFDKTDEILAENQNHQALPLKIRFNLRAPSAKCVFLKAYPFGLESFLFLVYYQTDLIMLHYFTDNRVVGLYGVCVVVMAAVYLLPAVLYQKFLLPDIHRLAYEDGEKLSKFIRRGGVISFSVGIVVAIFLLLNAPWFIPIIFGQDYYPSVFSLMVLSVATPFRYLSIHLGSVLFTRDHIWTNLKISGVTALLNIVLNLLLIPRYGALGAAIATVVSYITLAMLFLAAVIRSKLTVRNLSTEKEGKGVCLK